MTPTDIADEIWRARKVRVDRRKIGVETIKRIGRYTVPIDVYEGVVAEVKTAGRARGRRAATRGGAGRDGGRRAGGGSRRRGHEPAVDLEAVMAAADGSELESVASVNDDPTGPTATTRVAGVAPRHLRPFPPTLQRWLWIVWNLGANSLLGATVSSTGFSPPPAGICG